MTTCLRDRIFCTCNLCFELILRTKRLNLPIRILTLMPCVFQRPSPSLLGTSTRVLCCAQGMFTAGATINTDSWDETTIIIIMIPTSLHMSLDFRKVSLCQPRGSFDVTLAIIRICSPFCPIRIAQKPDTAVRHRLISRLPGAIGISAGYSHTCALLSGGSVSCWGNNDFGQLGSGSRMNTSTPGEVVVLGTGVSSSDRPVLCWCRRCRPVVYLSSLGHLCLIRSFASSHCPRSFICILTSS